MNCPKCGQTVSQDARFCGKCGSQMESGPAPRVGDFGLAAAAVSGTDAAPAYTSPHVLPGLIERIKNIILTPKTEWPLIEKEPTSVGELYTGYVMPLAAFAAVMSFIRMSVIGVSLPFGGTIRTPFVSGLFSSVLTFVMGLIGLYLVGLIVNMLAPSFGGQRDQRQALKTAAYALTPAWLGTVLTFVPMGALLQLCAGIYGIYVLYLGLPIMMRSKQTSSGGYTASVVVCSILVGILFGVVAASLGVAGRMGGLGGGAAMYDSHSPEAQAAAAERAGVVLGNMLGGALGSDQKGKEGLSNAFSNLAKAGQKMEQDEAAARNGSAGSAAVAGNAAATSAATGTGAAAQSTNAAGAGGAGTAAAGSNAGAAGAATAAAGSNADPTQNAVAATGGLIAALGGALGGSVRHDPVDFNTLKGMLPAALPNMQRTNAEGSSQQAMGVKSSSATAYYQGTAAGSANPSVHIKISDMSGVSGLLDAASGLVPTGETQTDTGFEKDTVLNGRAIHEKYDRRSGDGEVSVLIAKRFSVEITGQGVDIAQLEQTLGSLDLARLESMKDAGAH
jgi:Yip1 domain/zinc-ribbon domain